MAETVIFESERLEKRRKLLRLLLPLGILVLIIAVTVIIAVISGRNKGESFSGGEGTPYPYTWTVNKDGTITLTVPGPSEAGYVWTASASDPAVISAATVPGKSSDVRYTVVAQATGRSFLYLDLLNPASESGREDRVYQLAFLAEVTEANGQKTLSFLSDTGHSLPGIMSGGEEEGLPYRISSPSDDVLQIRMEDHVTAEPADAGANDNSYETAALPPELVAMLESMGETLPVMLPEEEETGTPTIFYTWECTSSNEAVIRVEAVEYVDRVITARLRLGTEAGSSDLRLYCNRIGREMKLTVEVGAERSLNISTPVFGTFALPVPDYPDEYVTEAAP